MVDSLGAGDAFHGGFRWRSQKDGHFPTCCALRARLLRSSAQNSAVVPAHRPAPKSRNSSRKITKLFYFFDGQGAPQGAQAPAKSSGDTARPLRDSKGDGPEWRRRRSTRQRYKPGACFYPWRMIRPKTGTHPRSGSRTSFSGSCANPSTDQIAAAGESRSGSLAALRETRSNHAVSRRQHRRQRRRCCSRSRGARPSPSAGRRYPRPGLI